MSKIVMLLHGVGNPDHGQYADVAPMVKLEMDEFDEEKCREALRWFQREHDMGGGNCGWDHGLVFKASVKGGHKCECLGRFSYNGRYRPIDEDKYPPPPEEVVLIMEEFMMDRDSILDFEEYRKKREEAFEKYMAQWGEAFEKHMEQRD